MSRLSYAVGVGERPRSRATSAKLLASAYSCAERALVSLEGLGGASNMLFLTGVGAGLLLSRLTDAMIDGSLGLDAGSAAHKTVSRFTGGVPVELR